MLTNNTAGKTKHSKPCCCRAIIDGGSVVAVATGVITGIVLAPGMTSFIWSQHIITVIKTLYTYRTVNDNTIIILIPLFSNVIK